MMMLNQLNYVTNLDLFCENGIYVLEGNKDTWINKPIFAVSSDQPS